MSGISEQGDPFTRFQKLIIPGGSSTTPVQLLTQNNIAIVGIMNQSVNAQANPISIYDSGTTGAISTANLFKVWQPSGGQTEWFNAFGNGIGIQFSNGGVVASLSGAMNADGGIVIFYYAFAS